jgi:hypothetical protein
MLKIFKVIGDGGCHLVVEVMSFESVMKTSNIFDREWHIDCIFDSLTSLKNRGYL